MCVYWAVSPFVNCFVVTRLGLASLRNTLRHLVFETTHVSFAGLPFGLTRATERYNSTNGTVRYSTVQYQLVRYATRRNSSVWYGMA